MKLNESVKQPLRPKPVTRDDTPPVARRLVGIDILRGLAVLAVVANHTPHYAHGGFRENPWFFPALLMNYGYLGVSLFIVISGFCIHRRAAIQAMATGCWSLNWVQFWKRRFWRLYPPYLAAIVLSLAFAHFFHERTPNVWDAIGRDLTTHLLMVHNLTEEYAGGLGNAAFWSLGTEEQLYGLYFVLFLCLRKVSHKVGLLLAAVVTLAWRCCALFMPTTTLGLGAWYLWPFHFWIHWALGAIAVDAYFGNLRLPRWCYSPCVGATAAIVGMLSNRETFDFLAKTHLDSLLSMEAWSSFVPLISSVGELAFALAFFCVMNWCVQPANSRLFRNPVAIGMSYIGRVSYSVYLVHLPVIFALERYIPFGLSPADWLARCAVYISASLAAGMLFYLLVERWFLAGCCPRLVLRRSRSVAANAAS